MSRIRLRIPRFFVRVQLGLASAILLGVVISAVARSWQSVRAGLFAWFVLAVLLAAGQLVLMIPVVQRLFYYHVWIGGLLGQALRLSGGIEGFTRDTVRARRSRFRWLLGMFDLPYENWIRESVHWEPRGAEKAGFALSSHPPGVPVLVQRDHLTGGYRWPGQAFATTILFNHVKITRSRNSGYQLSVSLADEAYGIYKNRGKQFLEHQLLQLLGKIPTAEILDGSSRAHRFLMERRDDPAEIIVGGPCQPLRWSSAGALPLVRWRKPGQDSPDDWFVLFFRGIDPVGWNLANGGSESAREWRNLFEVGVRELCEELVVLEAPPVQGERAYRRRFRLDQAADADPDLVNRLTGRGFLAEHDDLRAEQDGITIIPDPSRNVLRLHAAETEFSVTVTGDREPFSTENVIFVVNPMEAGIECIFIFRFELADNDYLIFGEVLEDLGALAREPVMLLRRSYVESQVAQYGSLGRSPLHQERRQLRAVPADDYHIFDADIALRERRLRNILNDFGIEFGKIISAAEAAHLRDAPIARHLESEKDAGRKRELLEARFHANWLAKYAEHFGALGRSDTLEAHAADGEPLLALCAVTWKTLELVCRHEVGA